MNSRERLMASLQGRPVDRPPVSFYEIGGIPMDPDDPDPYNVHNGPTWRPLLHLAEEKTDLIRMAGLQAAPGQISPGQALRHTEQWEENGSRWMRTTLKAGPHRFTQLVRRDPEADTLWTVEHFLKNEDDLRRFLELPDEVFEKEPADIGALCAADEAVGARGIVMVDTADPLCEAAALFDMGVYVLMAATEPELFHRLLERIAPPIQRRVEAVARAFPGRLWRIFGPEYAVEPYVPPHCFGDYVVRYTGPLVESIRRHGGYPRIHCHGRVRRVLPQIVRMGATAIDPLEPPHQGDALLAEVRRDFGQELTLFGNIEISDIETMEPSRFRELARRSVAEGTSGMGRGFVLMPTSCPYGRAISPTTMANYEALVEAVGAA